MRTWPSSTPTTGAASYVATDQGPVVQSALLRSELVRLRKESGLTQEQVAADLEWSPSKLIRVEGGRSSITKVDLDALITRYGGRVGEHPRAAPSPEPRRAPAGLVGEVPRGGPPELSIPGLPSLLRDRG